MPEQTTTTESSAKRSRKAKKPRARSEAKASNWPAVKRAVGSVLTVMLFVALIVGALLGREKLLARVMKAHPAKPTVTIHWPPLQESESGDGDGTWLDGATRETLVARAAAALNDNPFDAANLAAVQRVLMSSGWFAAPCRVSRSADGGVVVDGEWREPFAVVRHGALDYLVTTEGDRLEREYPAESQELKAVVGVSSPPPNAPGQRWTGVDVQAGLALLEYLVEIPGYDQVQAVDVSEFLKGNKRQLEVVTVSGNRIRWGGPVSGFTPGEQPARVKRERLARNFSMSGTLDRGREFQDIRFQTTIISRTIPSPD